MQCVICCKSLYLFEFLYSECFQVVNGLDSTQPFLFSLPPSPSLSLFLSFSLSLSESPSLTHNT